MTFLPVDRKFPNRQKFACSKQVCCAKLQRNNLSLVLFEFGDSSNLKRRDLDGCPITSALQLLGDRWTMLVIRELVTGPKRTMELLSSLYPISSRTLIGRLRDMENDNFLERTDFGGNPPHIEYELTARGRLLAPFLDNLRALGVLLGCGDCQERYRRVGAYCESCPNSKQVSALDDNERSTRRPVPSRTRDQDESIVLL